MANHELRGMKKRCQNDACGLPFYCLNREAYCCPNCGAVYDLAVERAREEAIAAARARTRPGRAWANAAAAAAKVVEPKAAPVADDSEDSGDDVELKEDASDVILEPEDDEDETIDIETDAEPRLED